MLNRRDLMKFLGGLTLLPEIPLVSAVPTPNKEWDDYILITVKDCKSGKLLASRYLYWTNTRYPYPAVDATGWIYHAKREGRMEDTVRIEMNHLTQGTIGFSISPDDIWKPWP